jgi:hypothetical protein
LTSITAMTLFAAVAIPVQLAAQQTRYKLIDLGTLGGPNSATNGGPPSMINNGGVIAGIADTTAPCASWAVSSLRPSNGRTVFR